MTILQTQICKYWRFVISLILMEIDHKIIFMVILIKGGCQLLMKVPRRAVVSFWQKNVHNAG